MHQERLNRAHIALEGLSVGDALGGFIEGSHRPTSMVWVRERRPPDVQEWHWTDDTNMALSIYAILRRLGQIDQDALALHFAEHYQRGRGYGAGARHLLVSIREGGAWQEVAPNMFNGGSFGNGGAMRVAPLGAYFADDMEALLVNARQSSEVTHAHPEGIAGNIAVAVAAAQAWNLRGKPKPTRRQFVESVLKHVPDSEVKSKSRIAAQTPTEDIQIITQMIGNGSQISAQDTVPFVLYCAARWLDNYEEAIWQTMSGGGDVDTTCAMVGGIVACYTGVEAIPALWRDKREALPRWAFED